MLLQHKLLWLAVEIGRTLLGKDAQEHQVRKRIEDGRTAIEEDVTRFSLPHGRAPDPLFSKDGKGRHARHRTGPGECPVSDGCGMSEVMTVFPGSFPYTEQGEGPGGKRGKPLDYDNIVESVFFLERKSVLSTEPSTKLALPGAFPVTFELLTKRYDSLCRKAHLAEQEASKLPRVGRCYHRYLYARTSTALRVH